MIVVLTGFIRFIFLIFFLCYYNKNSRFTVCTNYVHVHARNGLLSKLVDGRMQRRYTVIYAYNSSAWDAITMSVARVFAEKRVCVKWWWCAYCRIQLFSTSRSFFNAADATAPSQSVQHVPKAPESHESPSFLHDPVAKKFINCMMWDGKKTLSQRLFKETLEIVKQTQLSRYKSGEKEAILDPLALFHKAIENSKPIMGTTGVRRGGKLFHVSCL